MLSHFFFFKEVQTGRCTERPEFVIFWTYIVYMIYTITDRVMLALLCSTIKVCTLGPCQA